MSGNTLRHIAIIMDGNNRWAKQRGKAGPQGHKAGVEKIRDVMASCQRHGVEVLTLFAFSSENWKRPSIEVEALMTLFLNYLKREAKKLNNEGVRLRVIGRRDRFSEKIQKAIVEAEALAQEGRTTLVICADYGGQWDMTNAARLVAEKVAAGELSPEDITSDTIQEHICMADLPPPDLLIRTGGEHRISNFLLWQAAYSELYFSDLYWPDFGAEALDAAVEDFHQRQRRFGKTAEQVLAQGK
ncbi:di-trans,poly-cis-decaprenylcistransferase [Aestuariicella hydrocarbonica]|uniref:Ditrans,polycis-undecaprenyl-diphosphate synthase ((2E,6E)-farnesyl-diphosphate specific) n=1 Tax=Pseudomaricurvus hydrocarbonicus TaxID=1470433 RepID=A0A9E5MIX9_9GAMM|nr:di-trans,poly-cis-decaprenylcistransferase [Aestuariicella hydrocarbonica]